MMRVSPLIMGAWSIVILAVVAWSGMRLGTAYQVQSAADAARTAVIRDVTRVHTLRAAISGVSVGRRPDGDLITRVQRALANAGLPVSACTSIQPRADQVRAGGGVHVQTELMTLRSLSPAEFGAWLGAWRRSEPVWRVDEVQFTHATTTNPTAPGAPTSAVAADVMNRYDIAIVLAAPFVEDTQ